MHSSIYAPLQENYADIVTPIGAPTPLQYGKQMPAQQMPQMYIPSDTQGYFSNPSSDAVDIAAVADVVTVEVEEIKNAVTGVDLHKCSIVNLTYTSRSTVCSDFVSRPTKLSLNAISAYSKQSVL